MILSQKQVICTIKLLLQITDCINWLKLFVKLAQPVDFRDALLRSNKKIPRTYPKEYDKSLVPRGVRGFCAHIESY